ncbi:MAG: hypothetical protein EHM72_16915 [Calditrichaeota bacterium]|nr:MAG: hypothetical protein EHM72_16915 [Calditrichota bacterium]
MADQGINVGVDIVREESRKVAKTQRVTSSYTLAICRTRIKETDKGVRRVESPLHNLSLRLCAFASRMLNFRKKIRKSVLWINKKKFYPDS